MLRGEEMLSKSETGKNRGKVMQKREEKKNKTFVVHSCVCYLKVLIHESIINVLNNLLSLLNL